jgi:hypothetical protein
MSTHNLPTQGDGPARALLGIVGTVLTGGGIAITYLGLSALPFGLVAATPGLIMIGYGGNLLFGCAFYNEVDIEPGIGGFPTVTRRTSPSLGPPASPPELPPEGPPPEEGDEKNGEGQLEDDD